MCNNTQKQCYDIVIVGGGIIGVVHAYWAQKSGLRVAVIEADKLPMESSVRNFGFVTVSGQIPGKYHQLARKSAHLWKEIAPQANIPICHEGSLLKAQREESMQVLKEFAQSADGQECHLLNPQEMIEMAPYLEKNHLFGGLYSPNEIRINPLQANRQLHKWLSDKVDFYYGIKALKVEQGKLHTTQQIFDSENILFSPGCALLNQFPDIAKEIGFEITKLQMMEVKPQRPCKLTASIMSDTSMVFYAGFNQQPSADALKQVVFSEYPEVKKHGINTIIVQEQNGNLVIGDTHEYGLSPNPFYYSDAENAVLTQINRIIDVGKLTPVRRWVGTYPRASKEIVTFKCVDKGVYVTTVNRGKGMSICWAWTKENIDRILRQ